MRKPLEDFSILVTRTRKQSGSFAALLREQGARVVEVPTIEIRPLDPAPLENALDRLKDYDWLLFTSVNAADIFFRRYQARTHRFPLPRICCIGPATADRVRSFGAEVALLPAVYQAEGIIDEFSSLHDDDLRGLHILLPRARVAREILPRQLEGKGAQLELIPVYETVVPEESRTMLDRILDDSMPDLVTFTSSSTVRNFVEIAGERADLDKVRCAVIGPITAEMAREAGLNIVCTAKNSTIPDLVDAIIDYARSLQAAE